MAWLENYLTLRQQRVFANNHQSESKYITQGVPQGSIIGPLMYIIYANDMVNIFKSCEVALYADDTVLFSKGKSLNVARKQIQSSLTALQRWCKKNGIFVNTDKTKYMIFGSKVTLAKCKEKAIKLSINKQPIARVHNYCYLGMTLDEQLNYELHAQKTFRLVRNKLIQLRSMCFFLDKKAALLVYKNMILPILEYGDIFLSSLSKTTRAKYQTLQNKALRIALARKNRENTDLLHQDAGIVKLDKRRKIHSLQFVYRKKSITHLLVRKPEGRLTRSSKKITFKLMKPNTEKFKSSFSYKGFKAWNQLPASIQELDDTNCFKYRIKQLLSPKNNENEENVD